MTLGMQFSHNNLLERLQPFDMSCMGMAMYELPLFYWLISIFVRGTDAVIFFTAAKVMHSANTLTVPQGVTYHTRTFSAGCGSPHKANRIAT
jgi:hypothetical protein